jgi:hypothetical protein
MTKMTNDTQSPETAPRPDARGEDSTPETITVQRGAWDTLVREHAALTAEVATLTQRLGEVGKAAAIAMQTAREAPPDWEWADDTILTWCLRGDLDAARELEARLTQLRRMAALPSREAATGETEGFVKCDDCGQVWLGGRHRCDATPSAPPTGDDT